MRWDDFAEACPELAALGEERFTQSPKALDVLRDPRFVAHSVVTNRSGAAYCAAIKAPIDWEPTEPYLLFALDVDSAGFVIFGEERYGLAWDSERGLRRWTQRPE
jgi:hypothetical protein